MQLPQALYLLYPVLWIAAGFLVGLLAEKVALPRLYRFARTTPQHTDNVIFGAFRGMPIILGVAAGIKVALVDAPLTPRSESGLDTLLIIVVAWSLSIVAARIGAGLIAAYAGRERAFIPATSLIPNLVRMTIYIVGFLIILNRLDISITPILTALGVGGLAVALALQETLANIFAGLYLLAAGQIGTEDYIQLDSGEEGYVVDINWRSTTVRTIQHNLIIVPNSKIASATVTNYSLPRPGMLVRIPVAVGYGADLDLVERVARHIGQEVTLEVTGLSAPEPLVYLNTYGEFGLNLIVFLGVQEYFDQYRIRHLFMKRLLAAFREERIPFPFPIKEFEMGIDPSDPDAGKLGPPDAYGSAVG